MNVIYTRFSPRPEHAAERAATMAVQLESCQKYCDMLNMSVDEVIQDPETSARKMPFFERPGGQNLMTLPRHSNIIAMKMDRAFRDTVDGLTTLKFWKEQGVTMHFANDGGCSIDTSTAMGEMLTTFMLGVASWEPKAISERTSAAFKQRRSNGMSHNAPQCLPYGFMPDPNAELHVRSGHSERVVVNPEEHRVIEWIVMMNRQGSTLRGLCMLLEEQGVSCRGKPWHPEKIKRILQAQEQHDDHE